MNLRLVYRTEGPWWIAYLAKPDTMGGALEVARIRKGPALTCDKVHVAFLALGRLVLGAAWRDVSGQEIERWANPAPLAEHERAGHA